VETEQAHGQLINSRLAYVAVSRGRYDAQILTNDAGKLREELGRELSKESALETEREVDGGARSHATESTEYRSVSQSQVHGQDYGIEH
jgi:hypothetical protein